jgi:Methyltransferase FkbM domain
MTYYQLKQFVKLIPYVRPFVRKSFSLMGEDNVIADFFSSAVAKGTYIDIGSGHPCWGSNTYLLYQRGWTGLLVDPIHNNIRMSKFLRRRDISICAGVGNQPNQLLFFELEPYEFSTFDEEIAMNRITDGHIRIVGRYSVPILEFENLPVIREIDFSRPTFLNIDTEGFDLNILKMINLETFPFALICIEEWESPLEGNTKVQDFLEKYRYRLIARLGTSSLYSKVRNYSQI